MLYFKAPYDQILAYKYFAFISGKSCEMYDRDKASD